MVENEGNALARDVKWGTLLCPEYICTLQFQQGVGE